MYGVLDSIFATKKSQSITTWRRRGITWYKKGFNLHGNFLTAKRITHRMGEKKAIDGSNGLQLRSYQLEMLEENMHRNIIVAVCTKEERI